VPIMVSVESPPTRIYIKIESWDIIIITPTPVIILKTKYRKRRIPITAALRKRLDVVMARSKGEYLFTMKDDSLFENYSFREHIWGKALKMAGVKYRLPYSLRHSHAAWALTIGIDLNRLVYRMGRGSKQMVYEVYGSYIPGIEDGKENIRGYFGEDFA
ncbi:MAG: tyrosine-type recombinase/integrase, partial [Nitrospirota bacterium]